MLLSARGRHNAELADHRDYDERANGLRFTCAVKHSGAALGASACWAALLF